VAISPADTLWKIANPSAGRIRRPAAAGVRTAPEVLLANDAEGRFWLAQLQRVSAPIGRGASSQSLLPSTGE
jgi:hypothetical protein